MNYGCRTKTSLKGRPNNVALRKRKKMMQVTLSSKLRPVAVGALWRLGRDNDGGYVVDSDSVLNSDLLLAFGVADDWSFEQDFLARRPVPLDAFDGSVDARLHLKRLLKSIVMINKPRLFVERLTKLISFHRFFRGERRYHKVMVGAAAVKSTPLEEIIEAYAGDLRKHIFIKCDIEGCEYRILDDLVKYAGIMEGLAIEFHDVDLNLQKIIDFVGRFPLDLCHCHVNNALGVAANGLPYLLELSFTRRSAQRSTFATLPCPLDQPNNPRQEDIGVAFAE